MGTLGSYLSSAREARGIDLHDAAQQTRISINYLKAMEMEEFSRLPGEVFLKGFLKSYARFLGLDETEVLKRYQEMRPAKQPPAPAPGQQPESGETADVERKIGKKMPIEPLLWGGVIAVVFIVLLFAALPGRNRHARQAAPPETAEKKEETAAQRPPEPVKLYLEINALEDVWILVRTDTSPQKKAVLKKGESVIWSADERFLLSYGSVGAVRLRLNGDELTVKAPRNAVVRDLIVTKTGISMQKVQEEQPKPVRPKPQPQPQPQPVVSPQTAPPPQPEPPAPQQPAATETGPMVSPAGN